jgi:hypothetical protein
MNTSNLEILKQFYSVLNRKNLTEDIYNYLLTQWNLNGIDLEAEMILINQKKSKLTKSRRDAVPEFLILKNVLNELSKQNQLSNSFDINVDNNNNIDQISI